MSVSSSGNDQNMDTQSVQEVKVTEHKKMFQQLFQLQQNTSSMLNQVTNRVAAIDNKLETLLPSTPVNPPAATTWMPTSVTPV